MQQKHHHSCYRLFGGVDFVFSAFNFVLWYILYYRAEGLTRLQFEYHAKNDSLEDRINNYRANVRSIGSHSSKITAAESLHDQYLKVQRECGINLQTSNNSTPLHHKVDDNTLQELQTLLGICVIMILIALLAFMVLDFVMLFSTRHGKASNKNLILVLFFCHILSNMNYISASLELHADSKFCAAATALKPMIIVIIVTAIIYKPYQLYTIWKYYKDVKTKLYVDELEIDTEDTASSASGDYEIEKGLGIVHDDNNNPGNDIEPRVNINRQVNYTDISHQVDFQLQQDNQNQPTTQYDNHLHLHPQPEQQKMKKTTLKARPRPRMSIFVKLRGILKRKRKVIPQNKLSVGAGGATAVTPQSDQTENE